MEMMKLKLFCPVAPFVSANVTVTAYAKPGVYDPAGRPLTVRKLVVLYGWQLGPQLPPTFAGCPTVVVEAGKRATARSASAPATTTREATLLRLVGLVAAVALLFRGLLTLSVIPVLLVIPKPS